MTSAGARVLKTLLVAALLVSVAAADSYEDDEYDDLFGDVNLPGNGDAARKTTNIPMTTYINSSVTSSQKKQYSHGITFMDIFSPLNDSTFSYLMTTSAESFRTTNGNKISETSSDQTFFSTTIPTESIPKATHTVMLRSQPTFQPTNSTAVQSNKSSTLQQTMPPVDDRAAILTKSANYPLRSNSATTTKQTHFHSNMQHHPSNFTIVQYNFSTSRRALTPVDANLATTTVSTNYSFHSYHATTAEQTQFTVNETQSPPSTSGQMMSSTSMTPVPGEWTTLQTQQLFNTSDILAAPDSEDLFDTNSPLDKIICSSGECLNLCGSVLSLMDHTVKPCEDFYQYACGGLHENSQLLDLDAGSEVNRRLRGQIKSISEKDGTSYGQLKNFYKSCCAYNMIHDRTERILEVTNEIKKIGWFHTMESWKANPVNITDLLVDFFMLDSTPLFDILLDEHETNSSQFALKLVPPVKMTFLEKGKTTDKKACKGNYDRWAGEEVAGMKTTGTFEKVLQSFPEFHEAGFANLITEAFRNLQENIIEVISKYLPFEDYFRWVLITKKYEVMTLKDLQSNFPMVNWKHLISKLLPHTVDKSMKVHVYYKSYLVHLFHYLSEIDARSLHNSLVAMFAKQLYYEFITPTSSNQKEYCLAITKELLPDVAASLYLKTFPTETAHVVQQVFDQAKEAMAEQISGSKWLDDKSKKSFLEKLASLEVAAEGGRDIVGDMYHVDLRMAANELNSTNFLANAMNLRRRKRQLLYELFSKDASATEQLWTYFVSPLQTHEPLLYSHYKIVVPYAMLPRGRVGVILSEYNTAELGVTLARMMAHHFDFTGIHYGPNNTKEDFVSAYVYQEYLSKMKHQASEQVSKMDKSLCKHRRSRSLLANDFTSDQASLDIALKVFKSDTKTRKELQLFFLAMAQTACHKKTMWDEPAPVSTHLPLPLPARMNAVFAQTSYFSSAFNCSTGSNMNPRTRHHHPPKTCCSW